MKPRANAVRIGGASGFWGDSSVGATQLVRQGEVDYLVFDYLAELTMSILAAARQRDPTLGYATDFVSVTLKTLLPEIVAKGIRVVSNAGGMNPQACAKAITELAAGQGLQLKVAVVEGDDVMPWLPQLRAAGVRDLGSQEALPDTLLSANAYLGALPIRDALDQGADVVITGRCVDSAVTLGVLMHEMAWTASDWDRLAQASLAGHIIECGCQATGGLHTDWQAVPDWAHIGYPIVEVQADGSFVVTKPPNTGGLVSVATVGEQILYEIGDPACYALPDVFCDFTQVRLTQTQDNEVRVTGAKGRPPSQTYKVSATFEQGFRCNADLVIIGMDAVAKAHRTAQAILERTRELFREQGWADYTRTHVDVLGGEALFGPHSRALAAREVVMRLSVMHDNKAALACFAREIAAAGTSWSTGTAGSISSGRPSPVPSIRQCAFLIDKSWLKVSVVMDDGRHAVDIPAGDERAWSNLPHALSATDRARANQEGQPTHKGLAPIVPRAGFEVVPLITLAYARSGDKADISNIGVMARRAQDYPLLKAQLSAQRVAQWLAHLVKGEVLRYELPGFDALNFVCHQALDGGGMASLRSDPLGKSMAQLLLTLPIEVPTEVSQALQPATQLTPSP